MDDMNTSILQALKVNGRATASEISKKVNLSIPAVSERIRKMEQAGVIEKYTVKVNRRKSDRALLAFVLVTLDKPENIERFTSAVVKFDAVLECHHVAGEYDYLLKVCVADAEALDGSLSGSLKKIKGIVRSNTIIALNSLKEEINP
jgi:Lrp/AsnC family transcriptional regulator, leucine-responsive regulatory protein